VVGICFLPPPPFVLQQYATASDGHDHLYYGTRNAALAPLVVANLITSQADSVRYLSQWLNMFVAH